MSNSDFGHGSNGELANKVGQDEARRGKRAVPQTQDAGLRAVSSLLESMPSCAVLAALDGTIRHVNRACVDAFRQLEGSAGVRADGLVGRSLEVLYGDGSRVRALLANPDNLPDSSRVRLGPETLELTVSAVRGEDGQPCGVLVVWSVVTASIVKEEENKENAAVANAIKRSLAVYEFLTDGTITDANENFLSLFKCSLADIKGKHIQIFTEPAMRGEDKTREFWDKIRRGDFVSGDFKRMAIDGSEVFIQAAYNPIFDEHGKPYRVIAFSMDITHRMKTRRRMEQVLVGVAESATELASASRDLSGLSQQMSATAEETSTQANTVAAAAEEVSANIQTVSAGTEEMSVSIREIAKNAAEAARVASSAVSVAATTNTTVGKLGESSAEIGNVIKVITSIAQQTKLLALNATIEAARAGEAGKGFAVVANEVKELAKETAKATEDISQKIEAIQVDTRGAVSAIGQISAIINQINDIQNTIASAVEEQTATTNEIGRNVSEGARGANEIASNISGVATASRDTAEGAQRSLVAAQSLSKVALTLEKLIADFKASL